MSISNQKKDKRITVEDLGRIDYKEAWDYQDRIFKGVIDRKVANRNLPPGQWHSPQHRFLFCEHPHVITLGKSGSAQHLLLNEEGLKKNGITFYKINRGGDITYHGPGQVVGYPILDLDHFFTDIHKYIRLLEEVIIRTLAEYDITGSRLQGATGVWLDAHDSSRARKICAIGIRCSRWVTMHGFAFNVNSNLHYFSYIVPCGIADKQVTSLQSELGQAVDTEEVKAKLVKHFSKLFQAQMKNAELPSPFQCNNENL